MILCWNVGNTHIGIGLFENGELKFRWRFQTDTSKTDDDYAVVIRGTLLACNLSVDQIQGAVISCVVPALTPVITGTNRKLTGHQPLIVSHELNTGLQINIDAPQKVGHDRIANAVAMYQKFKTAAVIIDFGTATNFEIISPHGGFEGGLICPGLRIAAEALFERAAQLPSVPLEKPARLIGKDTTEAMQSGIFFGYTEMVEALIHRLKAEVKRNYHIEPVVVATGGLSGLLAPEVPSVDHVNEDLTLEGLYFLHQMNHE